VSRVGLEAKVKNLPALYTKVRTLLKYSVRSAAASSLPYSHGNKFKNVQQVF
jgi:hypothetical protein